MKNKIKHKPKEIAKINTSDLLLNCHLINYIHYRNKKFSKSYPLARLNGNPLPIETQSDFFKCLVYLQKDMTGCENITIGTINAAKHIYEYNLLENLQKYEETKSKKYLEKLIPFELINIKDVQKYLLFMYPFLAGHNKNPFVTLPFDTKQIFLNDSIIESFETMKSEYLRKYNIKKKSDFRTFFNQIDKYLEKPMNEEEDNFKKRIAIISKAKNSKYLAKVVYKN